MTTLSATLPAMPGKLPPSEKKVGLAARVDPAILKRLTDIAEKEERSLSQVVERTLRDGLDVRDAKRRDKR